MTTLLPMADLVENHRDQGAFKFKYRQLGKTGEGKCGSVFAGVRISDGLRVSIKYIEEPDLAYENNIKETPRQVAVILTAGGTPQSLGRSTVVALLDWFYFEHKLLLVMERAENSTDLQSYLLKHSRGLEEQLAKVLITQLVDVAIDLNNRGVLHRDLKCENILIENVTQRPRLRVTGFDYGTFVQDGPYLRFPGVAGFAPPECRGNRGYRAEPLTVWQLGMILYQMLHSRQLFTNMVIRGMVHFGDLSQGCLDFLKSCLAVEPKERLTLKQIRAHVWLRPLPSPSTS
ncbi:serine/threonine-protein kinase pim-1-like [Synchiropus picturatus]